MGARARREPRMLIGGDLNVSRLGFGAMRLTGTGMWGDYPDREGALALLRTAMKSGVTFIDTADSYGPHTNELLIRDALHPYPAGLVIATKGGFIRGGPDYSDFGAVGNREYLRQCAYLSARRLGVQQIDLYYLHRPDARDTPFLDQVGTLAELAAEGVIRHIGLSNVSVEQFEQARSVADIAAVTGLYNIWNRASAALLAAAEAAGAAFSPWHPTTPEYPPGPAGEHMQEKLRKIADRHSATIRQLALAWLLHRSTRMLPIPGTASTPHLAENMQAAALELPTEDVDAITALIPEPAPAADLE